MVPTNRAAASENVDTDQDVLDPGAVSKDMEKNTKVRKDETRKQLSEAFEEDMNKYDAEVATVIDGATKQSSELHLKQYMRLKELVQRRCEIEAQIAQHSQILKRAYGSASEELQAAAQGRLEDLQPDDDDEDDEDDAEKGQLQGHAGGVDERQVPSKQAVKNAEEMARNGMRI